jgi:hypothetical protein
MDGERHVINRPDRRATPTDVVDDRELPNVQKRRLCRVRHFDTIAHVPSWS